MLKKDSCDKESFFDGNNNENLYKKRFYKNGLKNFKKISKKVLTFISSGVILTKLSRETNESHRTVKNKLKKLLTSDERCDNLI